MNKKGWFIGIIIAIVMMVTVGGFFLAGRDTLSGGMKIEKNTVEWNQDLENTDESAAIQIPYYSDIYMEGDTDSIDMILVNPKENECYFTYTFILKETSEEIYQSDLIESGRALEKVKLNQKMDRGTYKLDIRIDTYSIAEQTPLNNAIVSTNLIVS
ncbi:MAG: hypothetical protein MR487_13720 [Lachnospiraceae bacterium]|nr:hypothetical protein [Lachnospiraceae bacterium]